MAQYVGGPTCTTCARRLDFGQLRRFEVGRSDGGAFAGALAFGGGAFAAFAAAAFFFASLALRVSASSVNPLALRASIFARDAAFFFSSSAFALA